MKAPLPLRTQRAVLRALLRNFQHAASVPRIARFMFCNRTFFSDEKIRAVVVELLLAGGDLGKAVDDLRRSIGADSTSRLCKWSDAVKGGAL